MIKAFYRLIDLKMILLLLLMLIISPTLCGKNTYTICLINSHYLTIYMNNVYLLMMYQCASRYNALAPYMITRIKEDKFYTFTYIVFISMSCLYSFIIYLSYYFFFGAIPSDTLTITIIFMILNIVIVCIENTIIYLQIGQKKNFIYLVLPILINFLFHFIFIKLL